LSIYACARRAKASATKIAPSCTFIGLAIFNTLLRFLPNHRIQSLHKYIIPIWNQHSRSSWNILNITGRFSSTYVQPKLFVVIHTLCLSSSSCSSSSSILRILMEPYSHRQSREDLQTSRSRASSHVSVGESSFRGLNIGDPTIDINISSPFTVGINQAPGILPLSSARFCPSPQQSPAFIAISAPQLYAPLPLSSQGTNVQDWAFVESARSSETPLLRLEQPRDQVDLLTIRTGYTSEPEAYSQSNMR